MVLHIMQAPACCCCCTYCSSNVNVCFVMWLTVGNLDEGGVMSSSAGGQIGEIVTLGISSAGRSRSLVIGLTAHR